MLVTFIINTRRDFQQFSKNVLDCIFASVNPNNYEFEILINSSEPVTYEFNDSHCQKFTNYTVDFRHGAIYGFNKLIPYAEGEYIFFLTDDITYSNIFNLFDYMKQTTSNKRFNISGPHLHPGQTYKDQKIRYKGKAILCNLWATFPLVRAVAASQKTINEELGGVIHHPSFFNGAGDLYMSWYAYYHRQPIFECPKNITYGTTLPIVDPAPPFPTEEEFSRENWLYKEINSYSWGNTEIYNRDMETLMNLIQRNQETTTKQYI